MSKRKEGEIRESREGVGAAAPSKCEADWFSVVNGVPEGLVHIRDAAMPGKITGEYETSGDTIDGTCTGSVIRYERRNSKGVLIGTYDGRIHAFNMGAPVPNLTVIIGKHRGGIALGDDDWMGGHTT